MPVPGPLGRLIARRRNELGLTQLQLANLTEQFGPGVTQNNISRLESGKTQRINDVARLECLGKALGIDSDAEFILAAYAPGIERRQASVPDLTILPPGPEGEIVALVRRIPQHRHRQAVEFLRLMAEEDSPYS